MANPTLVLHMIPGLSSAQAHAFSRDIEQTHARASAEMHLTHVPNLGPTHPMSEPTVRNLPVTTPYAQPRQLGRVTLSDPTRPGT